MTVVEPTRDRGWRTVPNLISLIRLLCVPVFVYLLLGADRPLAAGAGRERGERETREERHEQRLRGRPGAAEPERRGEQRRQERRVDRARQDF